MLPDLIPKAPLSNQRGFLVRQAENERSELKCASRIILMTQPIGIHATISQKHSASEFISWMNETQIL